jgi:uncharacterized membrane-anchored protein YhcB (DUF1043 family)
VKIDGRWYLADLDFMSFPWALVVVCSMIGVAFGVLVFTLARRSKKQNLQKVSPQPV